MAHILIKAIHSSDRSESEKYNDKIANHALKIWFRDMLEKYLLIK